MKINYKKIMPIIILLGSMGLQSLMGCISMQKGSRGYLFAERNEAEEKLIKKLEVENFITCYPMKTGKMINYKDILTKLGVSSYEEINQLSEPLERCGYLFAERNWEKIASLWNIDKKSNDPIEDMDLNGDYLITDHELSLYDKLFP